MARRKTLPDSVRAKYALAERLISIRNELYGDRGGPELARQLGLPVRTWYNYEAGVTVPAEVILRLIELTSVEPAWLLHGRGSKFRARSPQPVIPTQAPSSSVGDLLRSALQLLENSDVPYPGPSESDGSADRVPGGAPSDVVLLAVEDGASRPLTTESGPRYIAARSAWLDAEREARCIRNEGDSMSPIVANGAYVAFAKQEEDLTKLDGKLVVAWLDNKTLVRWFEFCGRYAVLRAENPATQPSRVPVELNDPTVNLRCRRVLWINTPH